MSWFQIICLMAVIYFTVRWALDDDRKAKKKRKE